MRTHMNVAAVLAVVAGLAAGVRGLARWSAPQGEGTALNAEERAELSRAGQRAEALVRVLGPQLEASLPAEYRRMMIRLVSEDAPQAGIATCFAPGTPDEIVRAFQIINAGFNPRFQQGTRWGATVLDPGGGGSGNPTRLTYSFVPDGTTLPSGAGEPATPSTLFASMNSVYGTAAAWQAVYAQVFARWQQLCGIQYTFEPNDDGAALGSANPGSAGVRGDLRFSAHPIDGASGVLAFNYFPQTGDMVVDADDITAATGFFHTPGTDSRGLRNVLAHEHGHGMGQFHVCPVSNTKLMEPFVSTLYDGPRHDDIRSAQDMYGDPNEPDNDAASAKFVGTLGAGSSTTLGTPPTPSITNASTLSIDDDGEQDWFRFTVTGPRIVSATVTPIGMVYQDAGQACSANTGSCCFGPAADSRDDANLAVELRSGATGATVLGRADTRPTGVAEFLESVVLPAAGDYYVRVYETGTMGAHDVQMYTLKIDVANEPALVVVFPGDLPAVVSPTSPTPITVRIDNGTQTLVAGSAKLFYKAGAGSYQQLALSALSGGLYSANVPPQPCGQTISFYAEAVGSGGTTVRNPPAAPGAPLTRIAAPAETTVFSDDFEIDRGWTVVNDATLTRGAWVRVDPVGTSAEPENDHTAAGTQCFITDQHGSVATDGAAGTSPGASDIDGGHTYLISPTFDLSGAKTATISYWRWYSNGVGGAPLSDIMLVQISNNNGSTWTTLETVGPNPDAEGGWILKSISLSDFPGVALTATMKIRVDASDTGTGSVVEAGLDDVLITASRCVGCVADVDDGTGTGTPDGGVTIDDLLYYLAIFDLGSIAADIDDGSGTGTHDGGVTIDDLLYYLFRFDIGC